MHEPTGYERDVAHKRFVVQYFALRSLLAECKAAKVSNALLLRLFSSSVGLPTWSVPRLTAYRQLPSVQDACVTKTLRWFEELLAHAQVGERAQNDAALVVANRKNEMTMYNPGCSIGNGASPSS